MGGIPGKITSQCGTCESPIARDLTRAPISSMILTASSPRAPNLLPADMFSETLLAGATLTDFDNETMSDIAYFAAEGADGYTPAGTWVTYTGQKSAVAIADYIVANNLGGAFAFDSSMDTMSADGTWTYTLMNVIADELAK